jgi:molybdopterin/thiamine biosynthesis adenylyltransferase
VGSGGIGGTVAHEFGRLGAAAITLADFDSYDAGNMNRQIACYADTLGRPKAEALAAELRRLEPAPSVSVVAEKRRADGFAREIAEADFVVAAADDYAFSLALLDRALEAGRPAGAALPIGLWAAVGLFLPGGPSPARLFGFAPRTDEEGYAAEIARRRPDLARAIARRSRGALVPGLAAFMRGRGPGDRGETGEARPPQLCPVVWSAASLLVMEAAKLLLGMGRPIAAPRWIELSPGGLRVRTSLAALAARPRRAAKA